MGVEVVNADGRPDMTKLAVAFRNFVTALKKKGQPVCKPAIKPRPILSTNRDVTGSVNKETIMHLAGMEHRICAL